MQHLLARASLVVALAVALAFLPRGSTAGAQGLTPPPPRGGLLFEAGPHDQFDNFPGFVDTVCAALR